MQPYKLEQKSKKKNAIDKTFCTFCFRGEVQIFFH